MSGKDFNVLLVNNADFLKLYAYTLTRDNDAAKDLVQETLFKALANCEKYSEHTNVKAWIYTIMRNIFINDYRRKARQQTIFDDSPDEFLLNNTTASQKNASLSRIDMKDIQAAIFALPVLFRQPFQLYYDGYKYNEIASVLKEPLGTIKSRIHFARKLLKKRLERF